MIKELAVRCRSYRGYDHSHPVTEETLRELVDLTRYVASSVNKQPLKYRIVFREEEAAAVQTNTKWAAGLPELHLPYPGTEPTAFIVICQDLSIHESKTVFLRDIGACAQTILLAATEMGLGGCMIGNFVPSVMKEILHLPEQVEPNLVIAIGKPQEEIVLTEVGEDGSTAYYRDETGKTHYVPKRSLDSILL